MDIKEFKEEMTKQAKEIPLVFNEEQLNKFYLYMNLLIQWNQKMNLTAIIEPKEIILKHFIDSLTILPYLKEKISFVDVGTGAGFPGIPIKIMRPDICVTLLDSLNKRLNFLEEVIKELELKEIETVHSRAEEAGMNKEYREQFDVVTSRAVANLTTLSEYLLPFAKVGGICVCMKGAEIEQEKEESKKAIFVLGGKIKEEKRFTLPNSDNIRNIIVINKNKNTPKQFPRKPGTPSKEPIK